MAANDFLGNVSDWLNKGANTAIKIQQAVQDINSPSPANNPGATVPRFNVGKLTQGEMLMIFGGLAVLGLLLYLAVQRP